MPAPQGARSLRPQTCLHAVVGTPRDPLAGEPLVATPLDHVTAR